MATTEAPLAGTEVQRATPIPARAPGVELIGEMEQSGFAEPPALVRRQDGQTLQLTPLLYRVLDCIDGRRTMTDIADAVSERLGRRATADDVAYLVEEKLRPLGVLLEPDGSEPEVERMNPLLALRLRVVISNPTWTNRLTAPFAVLFRPVVVAPVLVGFVVLVAWLLLFEGIAGATRDALYNPGLLVLAFVLTAASAGFHEFGHAAGCRYGGATPGAMGAGLYLVWPAFYTDVTDSYRLDRRGRLRTDLGGLYFNCIFALATFAVWAVTRWDALLVLVPLQLLQMVHQLLPFVRLDGYHILADLTGVPDLFARMKPTLASAIPGREPDDRVTALKPWVRRVVTAWVALVIPLLLFSLVMIVIALPRVVATASDSIGVHAGAAGEAYGDGDLIGAVASVLAILALALPAASSLYILSRLVRRVAASAWQAAGGPVGRTAVAAAAVALAALAAFTWWPNGDYEPIRANERGTLQEGIRAVRTVPSGRPAVATTGSRAPEAPADDDAPEAAPTTTTSAPTSSADDTETTTSVADDDTSTSTTVADASSGADTDSSETTETTTP